MRSLPLSPTQQAMLYHGLAHPGSGAYVQHAVCELEEAIDVAAFTRAWQSVVARHAILRTAFRLRDTGDPVQVVQDAVDLDLAQEDWSAVAASEHLVRLEARIDADRARGFPPERAPLLRVALIRLADDRHCCLWTYHHALLDGRAVRVVLREVFDAYDADVSGRAAALPPPPAFDAHLEWLGVQDRAAAERFWKDALAGFTAPTSLASPHPPSADAPAGYGAHEIRLPRERTRALLAFARAHGLTLNTLVLGAWAQLLHRYSDEATVAFGVTLSLRGAGPAAFRDMVGPLINTVPLRVRVPPDAPLVAWLGDLRSQWLALRPHAWAAAAQIRQWGGIARDAPLLDSLVVFEHAPLDAALAEDRPGWTTRGFSRRAGAGVPLTLVAFGEPELSLKIVYERARFDAWTIVPMLEHLRNLLEGMPKNAAAALRAQPLLSSAEVQRIVVEWNRTARTFADDCPVHELVTRRAARTPDASAVEGGAQTLTYRELDSEASRIAQQLSALEVPAGAFVGLCVDRTPALVAAMLAVLKAGAAYVPLDPAYPDERIATIVADATLAAVVTTAALAPRLGHFHGAIVVLDRLRDEPAPANGEPPRSRVGAEDAAYAVYTSGSTGRPKGIVVSHRALTNHTLALIERYAITAADRRLQFVSLGSDVLIAEVFPALVAGGTVVLRPDEGLLSVAAFLQFLDERRITLAGIPSAYWHEWVAAMDRAEHRFPAALRIVVSGMDAARPDLLAEWRRHAPAGVRWFNAYGPSETTCTATIYEADAAAPAPTASVPIGRPLANVRVHVLDALMRPVPAGVPGELYIGGRGVANGYLGQAQLTAARFVADPFASDAGDRLYRTGDAGRYLEDGNVEYLGRADEQVKIRGYRVEPREVEVALLRLPDVRDAAVVARTEATESARLIAYVVAASSALPPASQLRAQLRASLPDYMLPNEFVAVARIARTPEGKLDRQALPAPTPRAADARPSFVGAGDPLEYTLVDIWQTLLKTRVDIRDDFFDLGGDSLLAVQMMEAVGRRVGCDVPLTTLFTEATVARLANALRAKAALPAPVVAPVNPAGARPPFLFLHGDYSSGGFYCREVARALGANQPFYAVHPHGIDRSEVPPTIEAMAEERVRGVRQVLPHGPYLLGGYCAGGLVALEMARRLKADGDDVPLVVIIDAKAPLRRKLVYSSGIDESTGPTGVSVGPSGGATRSFRNDVTGRYVDAVARYAPADFPGRVAVLKSARMHDFRQHLGWAMIASHAESASIPGDHFGAITRHAAELGDAIRRCIDDALGVDQPPRCR